MSQHTPATGNASTLKRSASDRLAKWMLIAGSCPCLGPREGLSEMSEMQVSERAGKKFTEK
jgi:hypothetical protein